MLMRERDRNRKRMKRMDPEYRKLEQERDRDRKKARRSNEAFRQLEKLRDKLRKERKKGIIVNNSLPAEFVAMPSVSVEPEVIITDNTSNTTSAQSDSAGNNGNILNASRNSSNNTNNNNGATIATVTSTNTSGSTTSTHVSQINKGLLYPPPNFHHPLPIPGVTLTQLCHPILHQNLSATLYSANGIKQEFISAEANQSSSSNTTGGQMSSGGNGGGNGNNTTAGEEQEVTALIEPEIILQTSTDIISAPHHFHNHAHTHHLHQQQCSMFQHMSPQAHMSHMRVSHAFAQSPPPPHSQVNSTLQQQLQQPYASNKGS